MRKMTYLSPTSLKIFYDNREKFYLQYLCDTKLPREPQTEPMAVGSAFDAYVKSFLVEKLIGKRPEFERDTIFEQQVEPYNRGFARKAGQHVFEEYKKLGALADILLDLEKCVGNPRFESKIEGFVSSVTIAVGDVPFLGKPDIFFINPEGARITFDWKVNGYCSKYDVSPKPGYVRLRSFDKKENGKQHPKAMVMAQKGVKIAVSHPLDSVEKDWAAQLSIYSWLLGESIGSPFVVAIDQIACGNDAFGGKAFRIAQHRSIVTAKFQEELFKRSHDAWYAIQSGHIFFERSRAESDQLCAMLDKMANVPPDPSFDAVCR